MTTQTFYIDEICPDYRLNNAGCKARDDVSFILNDIGFSRIVVSYDYHARMASGALSRLGFHFQPQEIGQTRFQKSMMEA